MHIITLSKVIVFSTGRIDFNFHIIMRNNICYTSLYSYKISNSIVNEMVFFKAKYYKISSSIINSNKSTYFIKLNLQWFSTNQRFV